MPRIADRGCAFVNDLILQSFEKGDGSCFWEVESFSAVEEADNSENTDNSKAAVETV